MSIGCVIFDCDGVLVNTEEPENKVLAGMVSELGYAMSAQEAVRRFRGIKMALIVDEIEGLIGGAVPEGFVERFRDESEAAFERELRAVLGVEKVLDGLDAMGVPYCVASSGPLRKMRVSLGVTGLWDRFKGRVFSAYEIESWKPDPGLFLYAAKQMGRRVDECVVIEDSEVGVLAGKAAGMLVIGYAGHGQEDLLACAGAVVETRMNGAFEQVKTLLGR